MKIKIIYILVALFSIIFSEKALAQNQVFNCFASEKIFSLLPDDGYESVNFSNKSIIFLKVKQTGLSDQIMIIETNLKDSTEIMCAIDEEGNLVAGNIGCGSFNEHVVFNF